jgi:hypothetical protein
MTVGELENAKRRALNILDAWLDVTGVIDDALKLPVPRRPLVDDAVHCGAQAACGVYEPLESERKD